MTRTKVDLKPFQCDEKDDLYLDLGKLLGKKVVGIKGFFSNPFGGGVSFGISRIVFDDGTEESVEGEHDWAYVYGIVPVGYEGKSLERGIVEDGEGEDDFYVDDWKGD